MDWEDEFDAEESAAAAPDAFADEDDDAKDAWDDSSEEEEEKADTPAAAPKKDPKDAGKTKLQIAKEKRDAEDKAVREERKAAQLERESPHAAKERLAKAVRGADLENAMDAFGIEDDDEGAAHMGGGGAGPDNTDYSDMVGRADPFMQMPTDTEADFAALLETMDTKLKRCDTSDHYYNFCMELMKKVSENLAEHQVRGLSGVLGTVQAAKRDALRKKDGKKKKKVNLKKAVVGKNKTMSKKGKAHKSGTDNDFIDDGYGDYDGVYDDFM